MTFPWILLAVVYVGCWVYFELLDTSRNSQARDTPHGPPDGTALMHTCRFASLRSTRSDGAAAYGRRPRPSENVCDPSRGICGWSRDYAALW